MNTLEEVKKVFEIEMQEIKKVEEVLDNNIVDVIHAVNNCRGKIVLCGMGKSGHIARKISASMSSLGIHSYVLHPGEAMHGDLGTLSGEDMLIIFSNSGETTEICNILPSVRLIGTPIVAITSHADSTLAEHADYLIKLPEMKEACPLNLAPTSSTTAALVIGDAIAVVVSEMRSFKREDFALYHPSGSLGRKLTVRVGDIMIPREQTPIVYSGDSLQKGIVTLCESGLGAVIIVDDKNKMSGIITDGDLKRYLEMKMDVYSLSVNDVMTKNPFFTYEDTLAVDALKIMENREKQLSVLPVLNAKEEVIGLVRNHDIIKLGIFI